MRTVGLTVRLARHRFRDTDLKRGQEVSPISEQNVAEGSP
jgi:hypothetical protein